MRMLITSKNKYLSNDMKIFGTGSIHPAGSGDPLATPNSVISPHRSPDSGSFVIIFT